MEFFPIKVKQVISETPDSVTLVLDIPEDLQDRFEYKQGQYITIRVELNGHELRRSYSMSSSPLEPNMAITVKKVSGGLVSSFLHDQVKAGDTLQIAAPDGRFFSKINPEKRHTYYLFAAGSGITPLMSIIKTVLEGEPMSAIYLFYGSRTEDYIIFRNELDLLSERYNGQLFVEYILSKPKKEASGGLFGMFKKTSGNWQGKTGRIEKKTILTFLDENMPHGPESDCLYFVCGPGNMTEIAKTALLERGTSEKQIYIEHFANSHHIPGDIPEELAAGAGKKVIVHLEKKRIELDVPDGVTILDVLVKAKYDPPYSCTAGSCSTCMAKLLNGKVTMDACYALSDEEVKDGYILTCQSHPVTPVVELTYDM
jgi:ring-1,2-phenylacetyl-CoA epoxidase subunit PaaE